MRIVPVNAVCPDSARHTVSAVGELGHKDRNGTKRRGACEGLGQWGGAEFSQDPLGPCISQVGTAFVASFESLRRKGRELGNALGSTLLTGSDQGHFSPGPRTAPTCCLAVVGNCPREDLGTSSLLSVQCFKIKLLTWLAQFLSAWFFFPPFAVSVGQ